MTSVVEETAWWKQPESSWLPTLSRADHGLDEPAFEAETAYEFEPLSAYEAHPAFGFEPVPVDEAHLASGFEPQPIVGAPAQADAELPPPPPYGYRYSEDFGYHPYVAAPEGARIKVSRKAVVLVVTATVVVTGVLVGALSAAGSSGGPAGATRSTSASTTAGSGGHKSPASTPGTVPPSTAGSGSTSPTTPPTTSPHVALAPGIFAAPPTSAPLTTAPRRSASTLTPTTSGAAAPSTTPSTSATTSPATVTTPTPTTAPAPVVLSATAQWGASYGTTVSKLESEATNLQNSLVSVAVGNMSGVVTGCQTLENDVFAAFNLPNIPNATANLAWQSGLSSYQTAAGECIGAVNQNTPAWLGQASNDLAAGTSQLQVVSALLANA